MLSGCTKTKVPEESNLSLEYASESLNNLTEVDKVLSETVSDIFSVDTEAETTVAETTVAETTVGVISEENFNKDTIASYEDSLVISTTDAQSVATKQVTQIFQETSAKSPIKYTTDLSKILTIRNANKQVFYKQLSNKEQGIYRSILTAILYHSANVTFNEEVTYAEYEKILGIVFFQNPELFWVTGKINLADDGKSAVLYYLYDKEQTKVWQAYLDKRVEQILSKAPLGCTDLEALIYCHDYICTHTSFSKERGNTCNVLGSLVDGYAQCEGYTKGLLYLCNKMGIPCLYVSGTNDEGLSHAWCMVQLNGDWYNIDPTWDDPVMTPEDKKNVSYRYALVPDIMIHNITHFDANKAPTSSKCLYFTLPTAIKTELNADRQMGVYAKSYTEAYEMLRSGLSKALEEGRSVAHVKIATQEVYLDTLKQLIDQKQIFNLKTELNNKYSNVIVGFKAAPANSLNYIEVTIKYE